MSGITHPSYNIVHIDLSQDAYLTGELVELVSREIRVAGFDVTADMFEDEAKRALTSATPHRALPKLIFEYVQCNLSSPEELFGRLGSIVSHAARKNIDLFRFAIEPDEATQLAACKHDGENILHIKNPSQRMVFHALKKSPHVIYQMKRPTALHIAFAIKHANRAKYEMLGLIKDEMWSERMAELLSSKKKLHLYAHTPSEHIILGCLVEHVPKQYHSARFKENLWRSFFDERKWDKMLMREAALLLEVAGLPPADIVPKICQFVPGFIKKLPVEMLTEELCLKIVDLSGTLLKFVPEDKRTLEVCRMAIRNDWRALKYVPEQTEEICKFACDLNELAASVMRDVDPKVLADLVKKHSYLIEQVEDRSESLCVAAVTVDPKNLRHLKAPEQTEKVLRAAFEAYAKREVKWWHNKDYAPSKYVKRSKWTEEVLAMALVEDVSMVKVAPKNLDLDRAVALACELGVDLSLLPKAYHTDANAKICAAANPAGMPRSSLKLFSDEEIVNFLFIAPELLYLIEAPTRKMCRAAVESVQETESYTASCFSAKAVPKKFVETIERFGTDEDLVILMTRFPKSLLQLTDPSDKVCIAAIRSCAESRKGFSSVFENLTNKSVNVCLAALEFDMRLFAHMPRELFSKEELWYLEENN